MTHTGEGSAATPGGDDWRTVAQRDPVTPWDQPKPGAAREDAEPGDILPGWADIPQQAYEEAASGGWGTPNQMLTGPIPTIRRHPAPPPEAAADPQPDDAPPPSEDG